MDNLDQVTIDNIQGAVCGFVQRYGENEEILRAKAIIYFFKSIEKLVKELGKDKQVTEPFSYSEIETEIYKMAQDNQDNEKLLEENTNLVSEIVDAFRSIIFPTRGDIFQVNLSAFNKIWPKFILSAEALKIPCDKKEATKELKEIQKRIKILMATVEGIQRELVTVQANQVKIREEIEKAMIQLATKDSLELNGKEEGQLLDLIMTGEKVLGLIEKAKDKLNEKLKTAQIKLRPSFKKLAGLEAYCE